MNIGRGQIRVALFNFFVVKKCYLPERIFRRLPAVSKGTPVQYIGESILEQIKKGPSSAVLVLPKFINSFLYGQSIIIL